MTYQEFISDTIAALAPRLSDEADIRAETITKNNGYSPKALVITDPKSNVFPTIYLDEYYERAKDGDDLDTITDEILQRYTHYKVDCMMDVSFFSDFEKVKDIVVYRLVNMEKNRTLLEDLPHIPFLDLAVIFSLCLRTDSCIHASTIVHNDHMANWKVTPDELYNLAIINSPRLLGCNLNSLPDFLNSMVGEVVFEDTEPEKLMYVLSNDPRNYGASCILETQNLKAFSQRFHSDVFILPSSVHEVMLLADDGLTDLDELSKLVREVNETQLEREEVLSDHAYKYLRKENRIVY